MTRTKVKKKRTWTILSRFPGWLVFDIVCWVALPVWIAILAGPSQLVQVGNQTHSLWTFAAVAGLLVWAMRALVFMIADWRYDAKAKARAR